MMLSDMMVMKNEHEAWKAVVRLLLATGAVTEADCKSVMSDTPTTNGMKLFVALNEWGAWRHRQGKEVRC